MVLTVMMAVSVAPGPASAPRAFEDMARRATAQCPARKAAAITPGDLDYLQEDFAQTLPRHLQARLKAVNRAGPRCDGYDGLTCPTGETLSAYQRVGVMPRFVTYLCSHPNPGLKMVRHPAPQRPHNSPGKP